MMHWTIDHTITSQDIIYNIYIYIYIYIYMYIYIHIHIHIIYAIIATRKKYQDVPDDISLARFIKV